MESKKEFRREVEKKDNFAPGTESIEGEAFHEKMHTRFMSTVGDQLLNTMGIEVLNINIEKLRIVNKKLAEQISSQAVKIAELESQHKTLEKEGEVKREQAKIELDVAEAKAQAEYIVAKKRADGVKLENLSEAQAEYAAAQLTAKATAEIVRLEENAKIDAYILQSKAECEHAELMNMTDLSRELALITANLEGVRAKAEAIEGTAQIAYVPHLPTILEKSGGGIFTSIGEAVGTVSKGLGKQESVGHEQ